MSKFSEYNNNKGTKDKTAWSYNSTPDNVTPDNVTPVLYDEILFIAMLALEKKSSREEAIKSIQLRTETTIEQATEIYEEAIQHPSIKDKG